LPEHSVLRYDMNVAEAALKRIAFEDGCAPGCLPRHINNLGRERDRMNASQMKQSLLIGSAWAVCQDTLPYLAYRVIEECTSRPQGRFGPTNLILKKHVVMELPLTTLLDTAKLDHGVERAASYT
jgi:hypothetical protein